MNLYEKHGESYFTQEQYDQWFKDNPNARRMPEDKMKELGLKPIWTDEVEAKLQDIENKKLEAQQAKEIEEIKPKKPFWKFW